jgi:O-antigen ligase
MNESDPKSIPLIAAAVVLTLAAGFVIAKFSYLVAGAIVLGIIIAVVSFISGELALYLLILSMLLSPQFMVGGVGGESVRGRGITLRLDDFILVIMGLGWFVKTSVQKDLGLFLKTPLNGPIFYYFLACVISTLFGFMMGRVKGTAGMFFVIKYFEYFVVYFMAVNYLKRRDQIERFTNIMLIVCLIVCIVAILQIPSGMRVSAPFEGQEGEPNTLGGYLVLMLSILIGLRLAGYGKWMHKTLFWTLLLFIIVTLAATLSRSSWISLLPMAAFLFLFSKKKLVIAITVLSIAIAAPFFIPLTVKERMLFTFKQKPEVGQLQLAGVRIDTSTSERLESWRIVLTNDFKQHPIVGFGVTGYRFLDAQYARILAETGLVGLITFLILIGVIFREAIHTYRGTSDPLYSGLTLGYLGGLAALLTHSIGANTFIIVRIMEPFWFITAMIIMIPKIEANERRKQIVTQKP